MKVREILLYILSAAVATIVATSCVRDTVDEYGYSYIEGRETYVKLNISLPEMTAATRADMPSGADSEVSSLWVGIFSATTGKCTYAGYHNETPGLHRPFTTLKGLKTESGESYIVAVANPVDNFGYQYNPDAPADKVSREPLTDLLPVSTAEAQELGFTWDKYTNLAIRQLDLNDVNTPIGNLVMSGIYYYSGDDSVDDPVRASDWETANYQSVRIPAADSGTVTLPGAVHLRRLISQVTFDIRAVDYNSTENDPVTGKPNDPKNALKTRIIEVTPQSFQVRNVPYTSWLHERKGPLSVNDITEKRYPDANSGDVIHLSSSNFNYENEPAPMNMRPNYRSSAWFNGSQYITSYKYKENESDEEERTGHKFDFFMLENKRWASQNLGTGQTAYDRREKETKIEKKVEGTEFVIDENTGIYRALCGDGSESWDENTVSIAETMNNCAALVEIRCRVLYTDEGLDAIRDPNDPRYPSYKEVQYRSADVIYTVHLGGIGNNWNDFTHRRNHKYTYKITVMDIDRIIVEALQDDEPRPGIEGVVTDVVNPPFEVDCHYGWVNIQLSNLERAGGGIDEGDNGMNDGSSDKVNGGKYKEGFPFRIRYYDETNFAVFIDQSNIHEYTAENGKDVYWTWIEFRPTTDEHTIADYKPYSGEGSDGKTFRLTDVANIEKYAHPDDDTSRSLEERTKDPTQHWYTVFINEYVYETSLDEGKNNWVNYVNLSPRMCWLNTLFRSSVDDESNYIRSKYVVRQQSIQTFYSIAPGYRDEDINAIGMEHLNETFGFNLRWDGVPTTFDGEDRMHSIQNNNGRHNTILYVQDDSHLTRGIEWNHYMDPNHLQFISGINTGSNQYTHTYQLKEAPYLPDTEANKYLRHPYYVPSIYTYTDGNSLGVSDINTSYYLRILDACMNRNRDNNGNGKIDIDEIRWYVPASSEIVDLVLGRNSLETPLLDYDLNTQLNSPPNSATEQSHQGNTRFHYATSNQRALWAEEGTTINPQVDNLVGGWNLPPQQVRCVRALGTDLSTDANNDLTPAFTTNAASNGGYPTEIYPTFYEQKNQRSYTSEVIAPHQEMTTTNRLCYNGFEFSKELFTFSDRRQIGEESVWVYDEYEVRPSGWYLPDLSSWNPYEFTGGTYFGELREGGSSYTQGNYLPDPWSYSSTNKDGTYRQYSNEFWGGGIYYPGGNYQPLYDTYSPSEFNGDENDGSRIKFPDGWYVPDVTTSGTGQNFWAGFFVGRVKCQPGYYKANPEWNVDSKNYWPDYQTRYEGWFPTSSGGGEVTRKEGYYAPDPSSGPKDTQFAGSGYWDEVRIGIGDPREVKVPVYDETPLKTWTDPRGNSLPLFVLPYSDGQPGGFNRDAFVASHGETLELANQVCKALNTSTGRHGWRLPTMKEAALIKIAMDNVGVYKQNGLTHEKYSHWESGYDVGNFLACTFREFGVTGNQSRAEQDGYYTGIYYPETDDEQQANDWVDRYGGKLMGRIACITTSWNRHYYIRCVRDLQSAGE